MRYRHTHLNYLMKTFLQLNYRSYYFKLELKTILFNVSTLYVCCYTCCVLLYMLMFI